MLLEYKAYIYIAEQKIQIILPVCLCCNNRADKKNIYRWKKAAQLWQFVTRWSCTIWIFINSINSVYLILKHQFNLPLDFWNLVHMSFMDLEKGTNRVQGDILQGWWDKWLNVGDGAFTSNTNRARTGFAWSWQKPLNSVILPFVKYMFMTFIDRIFWTANWWKGLALVPFIS